MKQRPRLKSVRVIAIDPATYPRFLDNPENPFCRMTDDEREREVVEICAHVLAKTALENGLTVALTKAA
jgi:hypothetical protein